MRSAKQAAWWLAILCMIQLLAPASMRAASVGVTPISAGTHPPSDYGTRVVSHGIQLSLTFRRRTYSQDALVRVTVRLVNVSHRVVLIGGTGAAMCGQRGPGIQVTDANNRVQYPPAVEWMLASCGPRIHPRPLRPGHVLQRKLLAILRGDRVRAVASLGNPSMQVLTPPVVLTLAHETPPHLSLSTTLPAEIDVAPATPDQRGSFYLTTSIVCLHTTPDASGNLGSGTGFPRFVRGAPDGDGVFRLPAGCDPPTRWSFAGGWLNHPVVTVNYRRPGQIAPRG